MSGPRRFFARVLLTIVFFLIVTPVSLLFRITGFDPLALRRPKSVTSFWSERRTPRNQPTQFEKLS